MKSPFLLVYILSLIFISCKNPSEATQVNNDSESNETTNKGFELISAMVDKVGSYNDLLERKNVEYIYTYKTPDNKIDISTEKYIFKGEFSYGKYKIHERTLPDLKGVIEQGYDGSEYWLKHNSKIKSDSALIERVKFNRHTNFYWFAMMQKMLDPGLNYEYLGEKSIEGNKYSIVKVTFQTTKDKPKDTYQLYINDSTSLVDYFLFTVADFGLFDTPLLMKLEYDEVDGILIPSKRLYKMSTWNADISDQPWTKVTWTNIKFNTELSISDFKK